MIFDLSITGNGIQRMIDATRVLASPSIIHPAYAKALNHTGKIVQTRVARALRDDTGLSYDITRRAVGKAIHASANDLQFRINVRGGDISLKYFKPRETSKGVSAAPMNKRRVFAHTFMRGGLWPKRLPLNMGGHVFQPVAGTSNWGRAFVKKKSGVYLPVEVVNGKSREAFERVANERLPSRILHEVKRATRGVLS